MASPAPTSLTGVLERIIFFNEENHYTIAELRPETAKAAEDRVTIVGALPGVQCGETLLLTGEWTRHAQHGAQFKIVTHKSELPSSVYGIRKYLGSGLVPGIGKVYANKIVDAFGTDTFRVLSEESGRLRDVEGIGKKRATAIKQAWDEKRTERELYIFLQTYGVTTGQCIKLVKHYGAQAKPILLEQPYKVAREIDGIGFKTADRIAINLGFANDAPPRLDAGLLYALEILQEDGHTAYREADLIDYAAELLTTEGRYLEARIAALVETKAIVRHWPKTDTPLVKPLPGSGLIQLPQNDRAEEKITATVARLTRSGSALPPIKTDAAVEWAEKKAGFAFADLQRTALRNALTNKISVLTGGPGTGKTTILRALVDILKAKKVRVHLAAPTGRAAQRLSETTGGFASTIHRLLKYDPAGGGFTANENAPLATDFLVLDEASMLDTRLASALLQAVPSRAHLLLVGDTDQLPSVGAGNVLKDLIAVSDQLPPLTTPSSGSQPSAPLSARLPVTRLSVIYRQQGQSQIVTTAHAINSGDPTLGAVLPDVSSAQVWADLNFIAATDTEDCVRKVIELVTGFIPQKLKWPHPIHDVQILAPMHKGVAGVGNFNVQLQSALNPLRPGARGLRSVHGEYRPGDKVIQLRNNYDKALFNGDIGTIVAVDTEAGTLDAKFDDATHTFDRGEFNDLALAYAISIHKSQGSEYPVVIVPLLKAHFMMLQRNLIYTAITRGKKKVFLVGEPAAYAMAVRNAESKTRVTHLKEKILAALPSRLCPRHTPRLMTRRSAAPALARRDFLKTSGLLVAGAALTRSPLLRGADAADARVTLPFANGERELVAYPQKRPLIRLTSRPVQLETPFAVFNEGPLTPNDAFFVRYHLSNHPTAIDPATFRLRVRGKVATELSLSLDELKRLAPPVELVAVNQCSGNSRGFFNPRVNGGQLGHGAMGNARWTGIPVRALLEKAGLAAGARQVSFNGLDQPLLEATPDFVKALDVDHALDGEVMLAWAMNGADLPVLNGYPLRLIVPGYFGTYWVKHVDDLEVLDTAFTGFWMASAYRVADNPSHSVEPGTVPKKTIPINRFTIRSFITNLTDNATVPVGRATLVRGIAFDSGHGIREVTFSSDGGRTWRAATLGADLGRYSFREWQIPYTPAQRGPHTLLARAFNRIGETQPMEPLWNPAGYARNVVEPVRVQAI